MSKYQAPLTDIAFLLKKVFLLDDHLKRCNLEFDTETALVVAEEAGKFAADVIAPLNQLSDVNGARWHDSEVSTTPGFKEAYKAFCNGGWSGLPFPEQYGGQGLCAVMAAVVGEMWHAASFNFALCSMLTNGAVEALLTAGNAQLKDLFLPKLVTGEWTGTMNLTEPAAGSDLAAVQSRAIPQQDGSYHITGQKIFITYGEHDLTENIIHLVLARTPDGPKGVKGISLFVVPKYLVNTDGSLGQRNDVRCASLEHKLGIHGSPTAVMLYGEKEGAVGYLVGEENRGLEYMFIMMNEARFSVGVQGLSISDRAYQHALAYAQERVQGRAVSEDGRYGNTILRHPDVRRLLLGIKSRNEAMRALTIYVAMQKDLSHATEIDPQTRHDAQSRMELLVPVLKGWCTENAQNVTYDALQVFGGMGYSEETGAAQYYRDARITTIYEGTTAIQANDLVGRKTLRDGGKAVYSLIDTITLDAQEILQSDDPTAQIVGERLVQGCVALHSVVAWMLEKQITGPREVYAGSVPYLLLWGDVCGGWMHALRLRTSLNEGTAAIGIALSARFYAEHVLINAPSSALAILRGGESIVDYPDSAW